MPETKGIEKLTPKQIYELLHDARIVVRKAPPWKKNAYAMAEGTRRGLLACINISQATSDTFGTIIDPQTNKLITRKALRQKQLAKELKKAGQAN